MIRLTTTTLLFVVGFILDAAFAGRASCCAGDLEVHLEIARDTIVRNDCQVALVAVTNNSSEAVELDQPFHLLSCGPKIQLRRVGEEFEIVRALLQLNEHCNDEETAKDVVAPGRSVAEYLVLSGRSTGNRNDERLFDVAGRYELRASISVNGVDVFSETRTIHVRADRSIDFRDDRTSRGLKGIIAHPRPRKLKDHAELLASIPKEALLYEMGTLGSEAFHFVQSPDENRARWIEKRAEVPQILADRLSLINAMDCARDGQSELALEEFARMKVQSFFGRSHREEAERKFKGK